MNDDAIFRAKTWAEMATINAQLRTARRNRPAHPWCSDNGGCKPCRLIRDLHARLDDYLLQLEGRDPDPHTDPLKLALAFHAPGATGNPTAANCGICGDVRFLGGAALDVAVFLCITCDEPAYGNDRLDSGSFEPPC
jgi:hypothetical protein